MAMDLDKGYINNTMSMNLYVPVLNNPTLYVDPNGHEAVPTINGVPILSAWGDDTYTYVNLSEIFDAASIRYLSIYDPEYNSYYSFAYYLDKYTFMMFSYSFIDYTLSYNSKTSSGHLDYIETMPGSLWKTDYGQDFDIIVELNYFCAFLCDNGIKAKIDTAWIVTKADLLALKWDPAHCTDANVSELNRIQLKYQILTIERVRHFLAQCKYETTVGNKQWLREGENRLKENGGTWTQQQYENYYNSKSYEYKYRGAGYIQTTNKYNYLSFATFLIAQKYPDLGINVRYPNNTDQQTLQTIYDNAVNAANNKGYDIVQYTKIVSEGADYVAKGFAWEVAGFWWQAGGLNTLVDTLKSGTPSEVDKVTAVININASSKSYEGRRINYIETLSIIR